MHGVKSYDEYNEEREVQTVKRVNVTKVEETTVVI